jgi:hypothetical protein
MSAGHTRLSAHSSDASVRSPNAGSRRLRRCASWSAKLPRVTYGRFAARSRSQCSGNLSRHAGASPRRTCSSGVAFAATARGSRTRAWTTTTHRGGRYSTCQRTSRLVLYGWLAPRLRAIRAHPCGVTPAGRLHDPHDTPAEGRERDTPVRASGLDEPGWGPARGCSTTRRSAVFEASRRFASRWYGRRVPSTADSASASPARMGAGISVVPTRITRGARYNDPAR